MIGLILVTHGRLAEEMRLAMEHVVGPQRAVATVCIGVDDDVELRRADIQTRIDEVDSGDGVILLTDMFGGTPSNLAISMMGRGGVEVIAGMNLPMLVKLAKIRSRQNSLRMHRNRRDGRAQIYRRRQSRARDVQEPEYLFVARSAAEFPRHPPGVAAGSRAGLRAADQGAFLIAGSLAGLGGRPERAVRLSGRQA